MFDLDASKIVIVGVAALVFIPPKDLPRVMRQVGQFVGKMRRMASEFQGQFMDAMREADMADLRAEADKLSDAVRVDTGLDSIHDLDRHMQPLARAPAPATVIANNGEVGAQDFAVPSPIMLGELARSAERNGSAMTAGAHEAAPPVAPEPEPQHTS